MRIKVGTCAPVLSKTAETITKKCMKWNKHNLDFLCERGGAEVRFRGGGSPASAPSPKAMHVFRLFEPRVLSLKPRWVGSRKCIPLDIDKFLNTPSGRGGGLNLPFVRNFHFSSTPHLLHPQETSHRLKHGNKHNTDFILNFMSSKMGGGRVTKFGPGSGIWEPWIYRGARLLFRNLGVGEQLTFNKDD